MRVPDWEKYNKGRCYKCEYAKEITASSDFVFLGCVHEPYLGKPLTSIKDCPMGKKSMPCSGLEEPRRSEWHRVLLRWISRGHDINVRYKKDTDVLHVTIGQPEPAVYKEVYQGVYIWESLKTGKECGMTILDYKGKIGSIDTDCQEGVCPL
jgi:hypothetical protein